MIYLFFICQSYISKGTINISRSESSLLLYLYPYDTVELNINNKTFSIFSDWRNEKDLFLEVESFNDKGTIKKYGKFNKNAHLLAVYFKNTQYKLKFTNDGENEKCLAVIFEDENFTQTTNFSKYEIPSRFQFPIVNQKKIHRENLIFEDLTAKNFMFFYILLGVLFGEMIIMIVVMLCVLSYYEGLSEKDD